MFKKRMGKNDRERNLQNKQELSSFKLLENDAILLYLKKTETRMK